MWGLEGTEAKKLYKAKSLYSKGLKDLSKKVRKNFGKSVDRARKLRYYKRVPERGERESATLQGFEP